MPHIAHQVRQDLTTGGRDVRSHHRRAPGSGGDLQASNAAESAVGIGLKALDDAAAAKLLRAAQADRRMLIRVTVEMLLRTGAADQRIHRPAG
jgi:hypothetical protein